MNEVEMCRLGIITFFLARSLEEMYDMSEEGRRNSLQDAEYLATNGDEGLRYGALGWPHLKLRFTKERGFYLHSNGMDENEFLSFQGSVAIEFKAAGLPFHLMSS
jgi:hypothetical protein